MKTSRTNCQGIALVLVLGFLVLITGLIIAFFISVTNDAASTRVADGGAQSRQLTDTAINTVMGQIRQATTGGTTVAWASQPGMIRTYKSTGSSGLGDPQVYYKLYSAADMTVSTDFANFNPAADVVPLASGATNALYTDLNAPVNAPVKDSSGNTVITSQYPIFDPAAVGPIKGFSLTGANPNSMPVRWQYVLRDGTVTVPTDAATATGATASWSSPSGTDTYKYPSKANPIVGRIAYWTDDETCKVNINTACGDDSTSTAAGSFWDVPRVNTTFERDSLSFMIPALGEFQRFPGHPATVYLDKIFPGLTPEQYTLFAPRIKYGGTKGGTSGTSATPAPVDSDNDRLYASFDEFAFAQNRSVNSGLTPATNNGTGLTTASLERAKFFATAASRAPEVNLFNQPRVSMWPLRSTGNAAADAPYQTTFDKLILQCTTIGGQPYYFRRSDPATSTGDVTADNVNLLKYLQKLTGKLVPGFGGSTFETKYTTAGRDQILVEMLDYIRCTNLYDSYVADETKRYTHKLNTNTTWSTIPGVGQVAPLQMVGRMGFGRFTTISEAGLIFANDAEQGKPQKNGGPNPPSGVGQKVIQCALVLEPFSVAQGYYVIGHNMTWDVTGLGNLKVRSVPFPGQTTGPLVPLFSGNAIREKVFYVANNMFGDRSYGGPDDIRLLQFYNSAPYDFLGDKITVAGNNLEFVGGDVTVKIYVGPPPVTGRTPIQTITLTFPSCPVAGSAPGSPGFPVPVFGSALPLAARLSDYTDKGGPAKNNGQNGVDSTLTWISDDDVQRSLVVADGDVRQVAIQPAPPATMFATHASYMSTTEKHAHSFLNSDSLPYGTDYGTDGKGVANRFQKLVDIPGDYGIDKGGSDARRPKLSKGIAFVTTGDFDNGVARAPDGPYINKPDEGVIGSSGTTGGGGTYTNYFRGHTSPEIPGSGYFAPNRQIPSPGMFGSLSTGPWKTLLFRPSPVANPHPNSGDPKDFLLMDLFWMPIVQPYAISEPFSTAGKINMNYQIVPFTNIKRTTAFEAALAGEKFLAVPNDRISDYKTDPSNNSSDMRRPINVGYMITQMDKRFGDPANPKYDLFRSASEICNLDLEDTRPTSSFKWDDYQLTGDNSRERPYTVLYQKLTTKSNTYTVHYRVQALKQNAAGRTAAADWTTWNESKDQVLSENRGSSTIERYVDPNEPTLPKFLDPNNTASIDDYYRFRVISTKKFAP